MINEKEVRKYFILAMLTGLGILSFMLVKPFILPVLSAVVLAYIFYPIYRKINEKVKSDIVSATITTTIIVLVIAIPFIIVANTFAQESHTIFLLTKQKLGNGFECEPTSYLCNKISEVINLPQMQNILLNSLGQMTNAIINYTTNFIIRLPKIVLGFFIMLFTLFYSFVDGKRFVRNMFDWTPLKEDSKEHLHKRVSEVTAALLYGIIIVAIIQGIFAMLGFYIFDVSSPIFWGIMTILLSIIPFTGSWLIWLPASLLKMFGGDFGNGFGLFLYGIIIISSIEYFVKPKVVGVKAKVHPLTVLIGVIGGILFFGIMGIILGPLLLEMFIVFISIYKEK